LRISFDEDVVAVSSGSRKSDIFFAILLSHVFLFI
jgi:hypothetical protein